MLLTQIKTFDVFLHCEKNGKPAYSESLRAVIEFHHLSKHSPYRLSYTGSWGSLVPIPGNSGHKVGTPWMRNEILLSSYKNTEEKKNQSYRPVIF